MADVLWAVALRPDGTECLIADAVHDTYRCTECDAQMCARLGEVLAHHFAHVGGAQSGGAVPCGGGGEGERHAAWKQLFASLSRARGRLSVRKTCVNCTPREVEPSPLEIRAVEVEKNIDRFRGDVIVTTDRFRVVVEVVVGHDVSPEKLARLQAAGHAVLRILVNRSEAPSVAAVEGWLTGTDNRAGTVNWFLPGEPSDLCSRCSAGEDARREHQRLEAYYREAQKREEELREERERLWHAAEKKARAEREQRRAACPIHQLAGRKPLTQVDEQINRLELEEATRLMRQCDVAASERYGRQVERCPSCGLDTVLFKLSEGAERLFTIYGTVPRPIPRTVEHDLLGGSLDEERSWSRWVNRCLHCGTPQDSGACIERDCIAPPRSRGASAAR